MPVTPRALKEQKPCPECGSTNRTQQPGEYTLQPTSGAQEGAVAVRALVCGNCGYTALYRAT
jgi:predicted nucleic-acid-binding Zn-ribbon protein